MEVAVSIKRFREPIAEVNVRFGFTLSERIMHIRNAARDGLADLNAPISESTPFLTLNAIEAACLSGARFARAELDLSGVSVRLLSWSITGIIENAEPFAHAIHW